MENNDLTIVVINDFDYVQGGASKVAIDTANLLAEQNYNVYFFCGDMNENSTLNQNVKKICTNQGEFLKSKNKLVGALNGIYSLKSKRMLKELLKTLNSERTIIHVHGWTKCLSSSIFDIAFKMKFKLVLTLHDYFTACPNGGYYNYVKNEICHFKPLTLKCITCNCDSRNYGFKLYRVIRQLVQNRIVKLNNKINDVITISDFSEHILKQTLNKNVKIHRVNNPIDLDENPKKVDFSKNEYCLYVGRVSKEKGVDLFCQAVDELGLKGIVVGEGDQKQVLQSRYPMIQFVGWKSSDEVKKYMKGAKALVFPSRWYEGAPLTPLEAMQYGVPCVVSDCCAARDYIIEGKNGFCFKDIDDLKNKLKKINVSKFYFKEIKNNYYKDLLKAYYNILSKERKK